MIVLLVKFGIKCVASCWAGAPVTCKSRRCTAQTFSVAQQALWSFSPNMVDHFNGCHVNRLSWLITSGIPFNVLPSPSWSTSCYAELLSDIVTHCAIKILFLCLKELLSTHTSIPCWVLSPLSHFLFLIHTQTHTHTPLKTSWLQCVTSWSLPSAWDGGPLACGPFNGLLDSPFLLYVKNNPGECSKLITFGPNRLPLFSVSPLAKVQLEELEGSDKHKMEGWGKNRQSSFVKPPAERGTRLSFRVLAWPLSCSCWRFCCICSSRSTCLCMFVCP